MIGLLNDLRDCNEDDLRETLSAVVRLLSAYRHDFPQHKEPLRFVDWKKECVCALGDFSGEPNRVERYGKSLIFAVGTVLFHKGGLPLMERVCSDVSAELGPHAASVIDHTWDGIGRTGDTAGWIA